jgi:hypothetical protein
MSTISATDEQLRVLRHMLGIDDPWLATPKPTRDYYAAPVGYPKLHAMAAAGLVTFVSGPRRGYPYDHFVTTPEGRAAAIASHKSIQMSRGARQYHKWLEIKDCRPDLTFHGFLTDPELADARRSA